MLKSFFLKPEITGFRNFTVSRFCSLNYSFLKASDISLRFGMFSGLHCCSVIKELAVPFSGQLDYVITKTIPCQ